ncbi:DUF5301 domain-containing protein [Paenibacillus sp. DMB5]|uniref:DUF5301 domain-containing protein n=1 Tax=Paenibacillus sp. DMB5 TaxID=1780103 RepID=UPI00076DA221|nr:DUF5301 domain-containing protein [Paenibacillus sp. DMB5]KUP25312.1 hypothetical protein AWJ19_18280 [Paenibacillus sp. DMB5]
MKNRRFTIIATALVLVVLGFGLFLYFNHSSTFDEAIRKSFNLNKVSEIEIIQIDGPDEKSVTITDSKTINKIMLVFSELKLKKDSFSDIEFDHSYWITVKGENNQNAAGITLYDNHYLNLFLYNLDTSKNQSLSYKITNDFALQLITELFN